MGAKRWLIFPRLKVFFDSSTRLYGTHYLDSLAMGVRMDGVGLTKAGLAKTDQAEEEAEGNIQWKNQIKKEISS